MPQTEDKDQAPESPASVKRLRDAQERLLRTDQSGDSTVKCRGKSWNCYSVILSQRCEFFRAAIEGSFKESAAKVVTLSEETIEEVDMLLLYLYTLEEPDFRDQKLFKKPYSASRSAVKLGDKYSLPDLVQAGQQFITRKFMKLASEWPKTSPDSKVNWVKFASSVWESESKGFETIRDSIVKGFVHIGGDVIAHELFQQLCAEHLDFALAFMRVQAQIIKDTK